MKKILTPALLAFGLLAMAANVNASILYNYDWGTSTTQVTSDNGMYRLKLNPTPKVFNQTISQDVPAVNLTLELISGQTLGQDSFTNKSFNLNLVLDDVNAPATGAPLNFQVKFTLDVNNGQPTTSLIDLIPDTLAQQVGTLDFNIGVSPITQQWWSAPGGLGVGNAGGISLYLDVKEHRNPNDVPEPSSMILAGFGLLGFAGWRKLRNRA